MTTCFALKRRQRCTFDLGVTGLVRVPPFGAHVLALRAGSKHGAVFRSVGRLGEKQASGSVFCLQAWDAMDKFECTMKCTGSGQ